MTKTAGRSYERSFDAPLRSGRTLHERIPDPNVRSPEEEAHAHNTSDTDENIFCVLKGVLQASTGLIPDSKLIPPYLSQVFSASITGTQTRQLLWSLYENVRDDERWRDEALQYIFGLKDGRRVSFLDLLAPARQLWSSTTAQQNAWTLLNRARPRLRANLLTTLATNNEDLFLRYLFLFASRERWRKGTVDHLASWREQLSKQAPQLVYWLMYWLNHGSQLVCKGQSSHFIASAFSVGDRTMSENNNELHCVFAFI